MRRKTRNNHKLIFGRYGIFFLGLNEHSQSITKIKHLPQLLISMSRKCSPKENFSRDYITFFLCSLFEFTVMLNGS